MLIKTNNSETFPALISKLCVNVSVPFKQQQAFRVIRDIKNPYFNVFCKGLCNNSDRRSDSENYILSWTCMW
jgi:hypothetical protein